MKYTYQPRNRYHLVRDFKLLGSLPLTVLFYLATIATLLSWLVIIFITDATVAIATTILATSVLAALALIRTYRHTYYPYVAASKTVQQKPANVASAASFPLLIALGPPSKKQNSTSLKTSINSLIVSPNLRHFFRRFGLDQQKTTSAIEQLLADGFTWSDFAQGMLKVAADLMQPTIAPAHALGTLLLHKKLRVYLRSVNLTEDDIRFALWWETQRAQQKLWHRRWWDEQRLLAFSGIGLSWASGYTPFVDRFARIPPGSSWDRNIIGHEDKLDQLINSLARQRQSNVLLVGDPGVGRLGIIRALATRIQIGHAHRALNGQRVVYLNAGELIAQGSNEASQLGIVSKALREMERAGNVVVIIDGLSSILGRAGEQRINLTDILVPFLSSATVRVVVMTSSEQYHLRLKSNQQLTQYFEVVLVPSLSNEATLQRLAMNLPAIERAAKLFIPYQTIHAVVKDTASLLPHVPFPERAFDFLEEAIVLAQRQGVKVLEPQHLYTVIAHKVGVNLGRLRGQEKQRLLKLADLMHQRLVNQEQAVTTVTRALIRARAATRSIDRPIGSFLFLGPTGVGKTETAKTLAHVYFGSPEHLTRLDMSEFQGADATGRLIGSADHPVGRLTSLIAEHPFTVLLLDEFEKAAEQVHQLFLQVFDEGRLTDASGRHFSFQHAIIIVTSNAGAELIRQKTKNGKVPKGFDDQLKEHILRNNIFRPELINRFDAVITYTPLSPAHIKQIAGLMLRALNKRLDAQHGVTVNITDDLVKFLVKIGYRPEFGARPMSRAIANTVEFAVAQMVIKNQLTPGQQITLDPESLKNLQQ